MMFLLIANDMAKARDNSSPLSPPLHRVGTQSFFGSETSSPHDEPHGPLLNIAGTASQASDRPVDDSLASSQHTE